MSRAANPLMELIQRRLEELGDEREPMSYRSAAARSGGLISAFHLGNLASGKASARISDRIAQGVALAIDVPLSRVYAAAGVPQPGERWVMPPRLDRLPAPKRRLVEQFAESLLDSYDQGVQGVRWS